MGGLSRKAYMINKIRGDQKKPVLVIDAGAMLFKNPIEVPNQLPAKTVQAQGIIEAIAKMNYDAIGLAPQDFTAGVDLLVNQPAEMQLPWLSLNISDKKNGQPLFAPYVIKSVGDLTVGIIGLTFHSTALANKGAPQDYQPIPWEKPLKNTVAELKEKTDLIILLSSLPGINNAQIAKQYDDIHLIFQSGHSTANKIPMLNNNTLITQVGSRGKHVGRLDIDWQPSGRWQHDTSIGKKQLQERLDRINWQIGRIDRRNRAGAVLNSEQYTQLILERNELEDQIKMFDSAPKDASEKLSSYRNTFISLSISLPEDPAIRDIVNRTKQAVNDASRGAWQKLSNKEASQREKAFAQLAGWRTCSKCHQPQTDFWRGTQHAEAWNTLVRVEQQFNPDCLICHVTLPTYNKKIVDSQNLLAHLKEEHKTISCETCHGPARKHAQKPDSQTPRRPDEKTCLICHTPERDDNFNYSEKLGKIRCPAAGH